jgi:excisionase family DNA binding protein
MDERLEQMAYSPLEAARATGQSRGKIFKDIREGKLRAVKSGSRTLILRADLEAYLRDLPAREPVAA